MDAYLGEIKIWPVSRCPYNWHFCDGSTLNIADYQPLYAILGARYGGDGVKTFRLPDLRGRVPIHMGTGPGTNGTAPPVAHPIGQTGGSTTVTLTVAQIPSHEHQVFASTNAATTNIPGPTVTLGQSAADISPYMLETATGRDFTFGSNSLASAGSSQAHNNVMPSRTLNYIICTTGIFPVKP